MAKELFLHNTANGNIKLKDEKMTNLEYLEFILGEELRFRKINRIKGQYKKSSLPNIEWKDRKKNDGSRWQIDETLKLIALELEDIVEEYAKTDWSLKLATQANMRIKIKECLKKYGYPPEYRENSIADVIEQARYMMS